MSDPSRTSTRAQAPARVLRLTDRQVDDLSASTTAEERIAMVAVLSERMWEITGLPLPAYSRSTMPVRVVRRGIANPENPGPPAHS